MLLANEQRISTCLILLCKRPNFKAFKNLVGQRTPPQVYTYRLHSCTPSDNNNIYKNFNDRLLGILVKFQNVL